MDPAYQHPDPQDADFTDTLGLSIRPKDLFVAGCVCQ